MCLSVSVSGEERAPSTPSGPKARHRSVPLRSGVFCPMTSKMNENEREVCSRKHSPHRFISEACNERQWAHNRVLLPIGSVRRDLPARVRSQVPLDTVHVHTVEVAFDRKGERPRRGHDCARHPYPIFSFSVTPGPDGPGVKIEERCAAEDGDGDKFRPLLDVSLNEQDLSPRRKRKPGLEGAPSGPPAHANNP